MTIIYPNNKLQRLVEIAFMATVFPVVNMIEFDKLDADFGFIYIGLFLALTVLNSIITNLVVRSEMRKRGVLK